jgi:hypothetical protein
MTPKVLSIFLMMLLTAGGSKVDEKLKYLEQNPPSTIPEIFAPGLIFFAQTGRMVWEKVIFTSALRMRMEHGLNPKIWAGQ